MTNNEVSKKYNDVTNDNQGNKTLNPLIEQLKLITNDYELDALGFDCLGKVDDVYPGLTESYRIWIWENKDGYRIATFDFGNTHCEYACEGTKEEIMKLEAKSY